MSELVRWSLVEYRSSNTDSEGRYYLHDLIRLFAGGRLNKDRGEAERNDVLKRHAKYYKEVLSSANNLYKNGGNDLMEGLRKFDLEWVIYNLA